MPRLFNELHQAAVAGIADAGRWFGIDGAFCFTEPVLVLHEGIGVRPFLKEGSSAGFTDIAVHRNSL